MAWTLSQAEQGLRSFYRDQRSNDQNSHDTANARTVGPEMTLPKHPLSVGAGLALRDILDYIAPGGALILGAYCFDARLAAASGWITGSHLVPHTPVSTLLMGSLPESKQDNWLTSLALIALALGVTYVLGHMIASVSSFLLERSFVYKAYDWPYRQLLAIADEHPQDAKTSRYFYRAGFFWCNVFLVSLYLGLLLQFDSRRSLLLQGLLLTAVVISGFFAATLSLGRVASVVYKSLEARGVKHKLLSLYNSESRRAFRDRFALGSVFFYELLAGAFSRVISSPMVFDQNFRDKFKYCFTKLFDQNPESAGSNTFWLSYCFAVQRSQVFSGMLNNWRMQYAFARNLSSALWLVALYAGGSVLLHGELVSRLSGHDRFVVVAIPLFLYFCSAVMLARYYYLFACYFSRFVFRSFLYLNCTGVAERDAA
jgi:hypothetical protein